MVEQQMDQISEEDREVVTRMIERLQKGAKMAEVLGLDGRTMTGLEAQAYRLYRHGQFDRAKIAGRGVLALDEDRVLTRLIMGDIALEEYRFAEAVEHLEHAHRLAPEQSLIRARLGEALLKQGQREPARRHLQAVLDDDDAGDDDVSRCRVLLTAIDG